MITNKYNKAKMFHQTIRNIAQRTIDENKQIAYIYTVIIHSVDGTGKVKVYFPQDKIDGVVPESKLMTFKNCSNGTPSVGKTAYVLSVGGSSLTGGFIIAIL